MLTILKVGIPVQSSNTYPEVEYIHIHMGCVEVKMANTADAAAVVVVVVLLKKSRIDSSTYMSHFYTPTHFFNLLSFVVPNQSSR